MENQEFLKELCKRVDYNIEELSKEKSEFLADKQLAKKMVMSPGDRQMAINDWTLRRIAVLNAGIDILTKEIRDEHAEETETNPEAQT